MKPIAPIFLISLLLCLPAQANLLGFFSFDDGNTLDSSGLGNNGFNETSMAYAPGFDGMAGSFSGAFFDTPINLDPNTSPRTTFGAWVDASIVNSLARYEIISTDNGGFDRAITIDSRNTTGAESGIPNYSAFNGTGALLNGSAASASDGFVFVAGVFNELSKTTRLHVGNQVFTEAAAHNGSQTFTRVGAHPGGGERFEGLIDNVFMFNRALSIDEINTIRQNGASGILSLAAAPSRRLWSVDIQAVGGVVADPTPPTMSGPEARYGDGSVWNAFDVAGHTGTSVNPTLNGLVDSAGNPSSVGFAMNGTVSGWSNSASDPLYGDYAFVNAGNAAASTEWEITGLAPNHVYELMVYGGIGRVAPITVDINGDGSLGDETTVTALANNGFLFEGISPDGSGRILGNFLNNGAETNWSGFQLRDMTVIPEPQSALLLIFGAALLAVRTRCRLQ